MQKNSSLFALKFAAPNENWVSKKNSLLKANHYYKIMLWCIQNLGSIWQSLYETSGMRVKKNFW